MMSVNSVSYSLVLGGNSQRRTACLMQDSTVANSGGALSVTDLTIPELPTVTVVSMRPLRMFSARLRARS